MVIIEIFVNVFFLIKLTLKTYKLPFIGTKQLLNISIVNCFIFTGTKQLLNISAHAGRYCLYKIVNYIYFHRNKTVVEYISARG